MRDLATIRAINTTAGIEQHRADLAQSHNRPPAQSHATRLLYALDDYEARYGRTSWMTALSAAPMSQLRALADVLYRDPS
jgi:hypothetical protein